MRALGFLFCVALLLTCSAALAAAPPPPLPPPPAVDISPPIPVYGKFGCIDRTGQVVIPAIYSSMSMHSDGTEITAVEEVPSPSGSNAIKTFKPVVFFVSPNGSVKVSDYALPDIHEGETPLFRYGPEPSAVIRTVDYVVLVSVGYVDPHGRFVIRPQFRFADRFGPGGLAAVAIGPSGPAPLSKMKWGYIDRTGHFVIAPKFDHAGDFAVNGLAPVSKNGLTGYIDRAGRLVIPYKFRFAGVFTNNGLAAAMPKEPTCVWPPMPPRSPALNTSVSPDRGREPRTCRTGFIDRTGRFRIPPRFSSALAFGVDSPNANLAKVIEDDRVGYIVSGGLTPHC